MKLWDYFWSEDFIIDKYEMKRDMMTTIRILVLLIYIVHKGKKSQWSLSKSLHQSW